MKKKLLGAKNYQKLSEMLSFSDQTYVDSARMVDLYISFTNFVTVDPNIEPWGNSIPRDNATATL